MWFPALLVLLLLDGTTAAITATCQNSAASICTSAVGTRCTITCPSGCTAVTSTLVWGTDYYREFSGACRAAIHFGVMTDSGGTFNLTYTGTVIGFSGSPRNGVNSSSYTVQSQMAFTLTFGILSTPVHPLEYFALSHVLVKLASCLPPIFVVVVVVIIEYWHASWFIQ